MPFHEEHKNIMGKGGKISPQFQKGTANVFSVNTLKIQRTAGKL
jgi:hypothetical protein